VPNKKILLAGGGTAGHVEPALAVGRWLNDNLPDCRVEFLGTYEGIENTLVPEAGFPLHKIVKAPLPRGLSVKSALWPLRFLRAMSQVWGVLNDIDLLVGFGGYVCAPAYLVAKLKRIPIVIHEANALPGWANDLGMRIGGQGLVGFEETKALSRLWAASTFVGVPLRSEVCRLARSTTETREAVRKQKSEDWGFNPSQPIVVVFGGSLGAMHINATIEQSKTSMVEAGIQIAHAVGRGNTLPSPSQGYYPTHYFTDMPQALIAADLVICRSGAITCHELGALGVYSLLVPLGIGNGEQAKNAQLLLKEHRAQLIENEAFSPQWLNSNVLGLISRGKKLVGADHSPVVPLDAVDRIGNVILGALEAKR